MRLYPSGSSKHRGFWLPRKIWKVLSRVLRERVEFDKQRMWYCVFVCVSYTPKGTHSEEKRVIPLGENNICKNL